MREMSFTDEGRTRQRQGLKSHGIFIFILFFEQLKTASIVRSHSQKF